MESEKMLVYIITVVFRFVVLHICISVHLRQTGTYKHANRQWHKGKTKLKICTLRTRPKSNRNILCLLCAFIRVDPRCIFFAFLCCFWLFSFLFISFLFVSFFVSFFLCASILLTLWLDLAITRTSYLSHYYVVFVFSLAVLISVLVYMPCLFIHLLVSLFFLASEVV